MWQEASGNKNMWQEATGNEKYATGSIREQNIWQEASGNKNMWQGVTGNENMQQGTKICNKEWKYEVSAEKRDQINKKIFF